MQPPDIQQCVEPTACAVQLRTADYQLASTPGHLQQPTPTQQATRSGRLGSYEHTARWAGKQGPKKPVRSGAEATKVPQLPGANGRGLGAGLCERKDPALVEARKSRPKPVVPLDVRRQAVLSVHPLEPLVHWRHGSAYSDGYCQCEGESPVGAKLIARSGEGGSWAGERTGMPQCRPAAFLSA